MASPTRTVVGLMGAAVVFSLVGAEIKIQKTTSGNDAKATYTKPITIILGGSIATLILTLMAESGQGGAKLATGIAGLTATSAILIEGAPVWQLITSITSGKNSGITSPATGGQSIQPNSNASQVQPNLGNPNPPNGNPDSTN